MKNRYVKLTSSDQKLLKSVKKEGLTERIRARSQALLLSSKGFSVKELSTIFEVRREMILGWYNRWEGEGLSGLSDQSRSSRQNIFDEIEEKNSTSSERGSCPKHTALCTSAIFTWMTLFSIDKYDHYFLYCDSNNLDKIYT